MDRKNKKFEEEFSNIDKEEKNSRIVIFILSLILVFIFGYNAGATAENNRVHADDDIVYNRMIDVSIDTSPIITKEPDTYVQDFHKLEHTSTIDTVTEESEDDIQTSEEVTDDIIEESSNISSDEELISNQQTEFLYFSGYTDIGKHSDTTAEMLDAASEYYQRYQSFDNKFVGNGWIFIEAQEQSGLDAAWLYAMAVFESGWGTSEFALERGNYYGIGSWDDDLDRTAYMADNLYDGIVNGAVWIAEKYYNKGYNCMIAMNSEPGYSYAPGNDIWIPKVSDFINTFYNSWGGNVYEY